MKCKKDILQLIFYGQLNESERSMEEFVNRRETKACHEAYEKLFATFSEEQKKLFEEYYCCQGGYEGLHLERTYANGFKAGFWLAVQTLDFDDELFERFT